MSAPRLIRFVRAQARQRLEDVLTEIDKAAKHPEDPEAIHDLRVAIRRFTQCVRAFRTVFDPGPIKKLRRRLHKIMDHCGEVRTCDVALSILKHTRLKSGVLATEIQSQRVDAENALRHYLKEQRHGKASEWKLKLRVRGSPAREWNVKQDLAGNLSRVLPRLAKEYFDAGNQAAAANENPAALHRFRLRTKHLRYTLELFPAFYGKHLRTALQALRGVQDRLGDVNDCVSIVPLMAGDARAQAANRKLLQERATAFAAHWKKTFPGKKLRAWQEWMNDPVFEPHNL